MFIINLKKSVIVTYLGIVFGLISVCITPILFVIFLVNHTKMFNKLYNKVLESENKQD